MLPLGGRPLLEHAIRNACASRLGDVRVVLRPEDRRGLELVERTGGRVHAVVNPDADAGQSTSLRSSYLATRYDDAGFNQEAVASLSSAQAGKTIGELFRAVRRREHFTSPERKAIHKAINLRNELVHRFMVDRVEQLFSDEGRRGLAEELQAIRKAVQYADGIIASLIDRYLREYGASLEELQAFATDLFAREPE